MSERNVRKTCNASFQLPAVSVFKYKFIYEHNTKRQGSKLQESSPVKTWLEVLNNVLTLEA